MRSEILLIWNETLTMFTWLRRSTGLFNAKHIEVEPVTIFPFTEQTLLFTKLIVKWGRLICTFEKLCYGKGDMRREFTAEVFEVLVNVEGWSGRGLKGSAQLPTDLVISGCHTSAVQTSSPLTKSYIRAHVRRIVSGWHVATLYNYSRPTSSAL